MKAPHLMSATERRDYLETCWENALFLARMHEDRVAAFRRRGEIAAACLEQEVADKWRKEYERLKGVV